MKGKVFSIQNIDSESNIFFSKYENGYLDQYDELFMLMYIYIQRHKSIEGYVNLSVKDFLLYFNYIPNRSKGRINERIYKTLQLMIKGGFIQYIGCYSNGGLASLDDVDCDMMFTVKILDFSNRWNPDSRFTKILYSEIDVLRKNKIKQMGKVLSLYINIKKYISVDKESICANKYAFPSEKYLARKCGYGISTVKKNTDILSDIGMLYVKNYGSYLRLFKGKEIVSNSNNVYALEKNDIDEYAEDSLKKYLEQNYGFVDGFYPFCNNLPGHKKESIDNCDDQDTSEEDYPNEDILDLFA